MKAAGSDYTTSFWVDNTAKEVFEAISNARGWWQGEIEGNTEKLNDEFTYSVEGIHFSKQKLTEVIPNQKIVWSVTDSKLTFTQDQSEWTGTNIVFEITETNNHQTQIRFTHEGLVPAFECFDACSNAWGRLIQESLYSLITTGKGTKVF